MDQAAEVVGEAGGTCAGFGHTAVPHTLRRRNKRLRFQLATCEAIIGIACLDVIAYILILYALLIPNGLIGDTGASDSQCRAVIFVKTVTPFLEGCCKKGTGCVAFPPLGAEGSGSKAACVGLGVRVAGMGGQP